MRASARSSAATASRLRRRRARLGRHGARSTATHRRARPMCPSSATIASRAIPSPRERFGPPTGAMPLPAESQAHERKSRASRRSRRSASAALKGTTGGLLRAPADKNGNLRGWLIGGPTPGRNRAESDRRLRHHRRGGAARRRHRRARAPLPLQRGHEDAHPPHRRERARSPARSITGEVLLEANDSLNIDNMEGDRRAPGGRRARPSSR